MINKIGTYFKEGFTYCGLEISESDNGEAFFVLELKQRKNELLISRKQTLQSMEEVPAALPKNRPLFLCINTSNILTKKITGQNTTHPEALVNLAFPNLDLGTFYYEVIQAQGNPIVTISKKAPIDQTLKKLKDLKIKVSRFSLGVSSLENTLAYLDEETIWTSNCEVSTKEGAITEFAPSKVETIREYHVNGLQLPSTHLLSFSQIVGHLNQKAHCTNFEEVAQQLKWEFKNFRIFQEVLKYALAFFVVLLLANFFVYNHYHEKVGELHAALSATSSQKEELSLLDASVQRKQERVETLSASSNSKATYYLDLFAQHIPTSILLSEIKYQPLAKPVRETKPIILEEGVLLVSGISKDVNDFSFWVEELEKYSWVRSVETLDFDYVSKDTSNFLIEIGFHGN